MRISDWSSDVCSSDLFAAEPGGGRPFGARAIDRVPREWIAALPGDLLVGVHLELLAATAPEPDAAALQAVFGHDGINGSLVSGGAAAEIGRAHVLTPVTNGASRMPSSA